MPPLTLVRSTPRNSRLLATRICDLGLSFEGHRLHVRLQELHKELESKGVRELKPVAYFGDEWFCPEGSLRISVPFYLAHPRLMRLEESMMNEVEGRSYQDFMKLMRHEAGHCFIHAYQLTRMRKWRALFGNPTQAYNPENYAFNPHSRHHVVHLDFSYAQSHPEEDFAETFAVWMSPDGNWRKKYRAWPQALQKLQFVEEAAKQFGNEMPLVPKGRVMASAKNLRSTLGAFYLRRHNLGPPVERPNLTD